MTVSTFIDSVMRCDVLDVVEAVLTGAFVFYAGVLFFCLAVVIYFLTKGVE